MDAQRATKATMKIMRRLREEETGNHVFEKLLTFPREGALLPPPTNDRTPRCLDNSLTRMYHIQPPQRR
jgi:hypothetical protein